METMDESIEFLNKWWGEMTTAKLCMAIGEERKVNPPTMKEFLNHCVACGGDWGGMLLSGIHELYPKVWDAIPDSMGIQAWGCICETLNLLGIKAEE